MPGGACPRSVSGALSVGFPSPAAIESPARDILALRWSMMRILSGLLLALCLLSGSGFPQTQPCTVTDHAEYTKKIKEFTTESFFSTELVDHLPLSSCVPPPDAF